MNLRPILSRMGARGAALIALAALTGCGAGKPPQAADTATAGQAALTAAIARAQKPTAKACQMVTEAEMSSILGVAVTAKDLTHSSGATDCKWSTPSGFPAVELEVDWGDGEVAMGAASIMNRREPGITSPYDGLGDQAIAVGPALMIQTGEDLIKMIFTGVTDAPAKAKKIFTAAKARM
jgi:hypothetical protein